MPGTIAEDRTDQLGARGKGPGGRRLKWGEMIPLTPEQSERLGELFAQFNHLMVPYARRKLMTWRGLSIARAGALAEDIAQEAWVRVARTRDVLEPGLTRDQLHAMLFRTVQHRITEYFAVPMAAEEPMAGEDAADCQTLCLFMTEQCAMAELPTHLRRMVEKLPDREREALMLALDGTSAEPIGEHLGCNKTTALQLLKTAVVLLKVVNPVLTGGPVDPMSLPLWQREALSGTDPVWRSVLLRLDDDVRSVLLLLEQGVTRAEAVERLGVPVNLVKAVSRCLPHLRSLTADDLAVAA
ncbi:RNA polymerase sigma factor [Streptomyces sp. SID12501]|uniref:Sigma-70 family RNA polymerase sigma factor n=1 Tax=Streptomyces sp. SID12501 TaxID=2706042 RepID=A0A6B3C7D9_9ACTN|nr:sigma-70 family RNA polymerase sigma factor [Streptomyces sp. SID12501]NEC92618.1 sigma-70 family RNA polymerase sigma factor [Streptomyces sp. SID12501]